jgi:hypothetical protein
MKKIRKGRRFISEIAIKSRQDEYEGEKQKEQQKQQDLHCAKNLYQLEDRKNKSANELFNSISNRIHVLAGGKISESESREAARRFISFCQLIVDYKIRQTTQQVEEKAAKANNKNGYKSQQPQQKPGAISVKKSVKTAKSEESV